MSSTVTSAARVSPQQSLPDPSGLTQKAELRVTRFRDLAAEALPTSQKVAASDLELSEGRLSSKLKDGTLRLCDLEQFGPEYAARFGEALTRRFGRTSPVGQAIEDLKQARTAVDRALDLLMEGR